MKCIIYFESPFLYIYEEKNLTCFLLNNLKRIKRLLSVYVTFGKGSIKIENILAKIINTIRFVHY